MGHRRPLMHSEQLLEVLSLSQNATAIYRDEEIIIQTANDAMIRLWGKDRSIIGMPLEEAVPELIGQPFLGLLKNVWNSGKTHTAESTPALLDDGGHLKTFYFDFEYRAILDQEGKTYCILHTAVDVTDRLESNRLITDKERKEQELMDKLLARNDTITLLNKNYHATNKELSLMVKEVVRSRETLNLAIEAANLSIWMVHPLTDELLIDQHGKGIEGLTSESGLTKDALLEMMLSVDRDRIKESIDTAIANNSSFDEELMVFPKVNEKPIWIKLNGKGFVDAETQQPYIAGTMLDITERRTDEIRKSDFIAMVSHELKTPLTSLQGFVQLMALRALKQDDQTASVLMAKANNQLKKMTAMINGFLNVSRLESGKVQVDPSVFDMVALVNEIVEEANLFLLDTKIGFEQEEAIAITADRDKIGQVINNLISNARKYSSAGKKIQISCYRSGSMVVVSVKDEGIGVESKDLDKLFDRYYRVENNNVLNVAGFGIGLYLCAEIIKRHNGKIWAESEVGKGSTFCFSLPF